MRKGDNLEKLFPEPCNKTFLSLNPPPPLMTIFPVASRLRREEARENIRTLG